MRNPSKCYWLHDAPKTPVYFQHRHNNLAGSINRSLKGRRVSLWWAWVVAHTPPRNFLLSPPSMQKRYKERVVPTKLDPAPPWKQHDLSLLFDDKRIARTLTGTEVTLVSNTRNHTPYAKLKTNYTVIQKWIRFSSDLDQRHIIETKIFVLFSQSHTNGFVCSIRQQTAGTVSHLATMQ